VFTTQLNAQLIVTTSFSQNGVLVSTNLAPGSSATIQWASSLSGSWNNLYSLTVASNDEIVASVPMFYRVLGVPATNSAGMAPVPAGSFMMGDTLDHEGDAVPTDIYVSAFDMHTNLVSYTLWLTVYFYATSHGYGFDDAGSARTVNPGVQPVEAVNWYDCVKWCNARSQQAGWTPVYYTDAGLTQVYTNGDTDAVYPDWSANGFRLPTEAEWEKAARGGLSGQRFPWGLTISESQANYDSQPLYPYDLSPYSGYNTNFDTVGEPNTTPVGYFAPNAYGYYDMAGNLAEWCWDWYGTPYGQPTTNNPTGPSSGGGRVARGGSWGDDAYGTRCAIRFDFNPDTANSNVGFRCVRGQ
jgi:formylglycine-generating enzyme required for sulfatase activity